MITIATDAAYIQQQFDNTDFGSIEVANAVGETYARLAEAHSQKLMPQQREQNKLRAMRSNATEVARGADAAAMLFRGTSVGLCN